MEFAVLILPPSDDLQSDETYETWFHNLVTEWAAVHNLEVAIVPLGDDDGEAEEDQER